MQLPRKWMFLLVPKLRLKTYLIVACVLLACTFYWDLVTLNILYGSETAGKFREKKKFGWEWACNPVTQQCQRQEPDHASGASLTTCLMTCGPPMLWPLPTGTVSLSRGTFAFHFNQIKVQFKRSHNKVTNELLQACVKLFKENVKSLCERTPSADGATVAVSITVTASSSDVKFVLNADESYRLLINKNASVLSVSLHSMTYLGARHGLETLLQLIWWDEKSNSLKTIDKAAIQDGPYFTYRGLHLDTARHYIPVDAIMRTIDAMSMHKLNVFHWHMTDAHSFPFYSKKHAKMALYGAYSDSEIYTLEDVRSVAEFAEVRGVRVSVEIDTPGRAGYGWNLGAQYGNLSLCLNFRPWDQYCDQPPCGQINPSNENAYKILQDLYSEISNSTGEPDFLHIGGDGVDLRCWESSEEVTGMEVYSKKGVLGVWELYESKLLDSLSEFKSASRNVIVWANALRGALDHDNSKYYIVQSHGESNWGETEKLLSNNYRVIVSHADKWFLNLQPQWENVYRHRPWFDAILSKKDLIIGGEVCLWTEKIDALSLDSVIWPQAAAFAERLWSDPEEQPMLNVTTRLSFHRGRILKRGINANVLGPKWCLQNPGGCD